MFRSNERKCFTIHCAVHTDIDRILITRQQIAARVRDMAQCIAADLESLAGDGRDIVLMPVLTGSILFVADLIRELPHKIKLHLVTVSSYPGKSTASQGASLQSELPDLTDQHVLIVDDILDSGRTIRMLRDAVAARGARSVRVCVLLRKKIPSALETPADYIGFDIDDEFVVGYGLDYDNFYRNLPDVATLRKEALR